MRFSTLAAAAAAGLPLFYAAPLAAPQSTLPLCDPTNLITNGGFETGSASSWNISSGPVGLYTFSTNPYPNNPQIHYFSGVYIPNSFYPGLEWYEITQTVTNQLPANVTLTMTSGMGQFGNMASWQAFMGSSARISATIDGTGVHTNWQTLIPNQQGASQQAWISSQPVKLQPGSHTFKIRVDYLTDIGDTEVSVDNVVLKVSPQTGCRTS